MSEFADDITRKKKELDTVMKMLRSSRTTKSGRAAAKSSATNNTTNNKPTTRGAANNNNTTFSTINQASATNKSNTSRKSLDRAAKNNKMEVAMMTNSNSNSQHATNNSTKRKSNTNNVTSELSIAGHAAQRRRRSSKPSSSEKDLQAKSNQSAASSSTTSHVPVVFLASNTNGGIKKKFYAKKSAAPVAQACVDKHPGNAMKQCSSLANTERQRNSRGDNNNMHNSISMLSLASYKRGAGTFFSQSSDPEGKLSRIQNVLAKFPNKTTGLATKASNLVSIVNTPVYNAFVPENVLKLADYGNNNANKFNYMINGFLRVGAVVVYGHSQVNADNAHLMEVFILHDYLTSGNHNLCKTLLQASNNRINVQRFDCHECDNVVVPGCGDKYCEDCKPEYCTVSYEDWKRDRYDNMSDLGKSRIKGKSGNVWNETKEDWKGCASKVHKGSGGHFLCARCMP